MGLREDIQSKTSVESVGDRKIESATGFFKNEEKFFDANGIFLRISSAIETKYLLKESERISVSVTGVLLILIHIG